MQFALLPPTCLLCGDGGAPGRDLCTDCLAALPALGPSCPTCAMPLPADQPPVACGRCQARSPPFARSSAPYRYAAPLDQLVVQLKFGGRLAVARLLGELLAAHLAGAGLPRPEAVVPVPLHRDRLRTRGFDQALELARPVARRLGVALCATAVRRVSATPPQSDLPLAARRRNLRGAFAARPARGGHVLLVDDVVTSGETAAAVATALRRAGWEEVTVACVARTPLPGH